MRYLLASIVVVLSSVFALTAFTSPPDEPCAATGAVNNNGWDLVCGGDCTGTNECDVPTTAGEDDIGKYFACDCDEDNDDLETNCCQLVIDDENNLDVRGSCTAQGCGGPGPCRVCLDVPGPGRAQSACAPCPEEL